MKRKGFIGDIVVYIIALFMLSIVFLVIYYALSEINTGWQNSSSVPQESKDIVGDYKNRFAGVYDSVYLFLVIGYFVVTVLLAYFLRTMPGFALLSVILMLIFGIIAVTFSNVFFDFANTDGISSVSGDFVMMSWLGQKLPHIIIIFGVIFIIVLYAKSSGDGAGL